MPAVPFDVQPKSAASPLKQNKLNEWNILVIAMYEEEEEFLAKA